ncbi:hypothetical protein PC41400_14560 [Paenibacillus chitinolyticus]|uniref:DUF4363 domain-containing protein n=1 Tax=Paenibacillus chitinolyticus TaxID=79263 RepID=A0A410WWT9_9BACL|nr:hypothetical protein [Paenibacillus chitinolyticus]MCY9599664.1 hypothetical protein [Paenibacillus chitinolyticus]QAV18834.1 hypothetical protein PC41400_14560 [Paenibacillus chitinolyticus]
MIKRLSKTIITVLLCLSVLTLSACGMNSEFVKDTKAVMESIAYDVMHNVTDTESTQKKVDAYHAKWKEKVKEGDETNLLNIVGELMGYEILYALKTDGADRMVVFTDYRRKENEAKKLME